MSRLLSLIAILVLITGCRTRMPPPDVEVRRDPSTQWEQVLRQIVLADGSVDYEHLEANRYALDRYVAWLAKKKPEVSLINPRRAMWLNAYNALVLYQVLERDRPTSAWDVNGWLPVRGSGFFYETEFMVDRQWVSLWEIRNEQLRMRNMDVRVHSGIACPAKSCPPMPTHLFRQQTVQKDLRARMQIWVNRDVRVEDGEAVFPALWNEYSGDFDFWTGHDDLCITAARHASPELQVDLSKLSNRGCPHRFDPFDDALNERAQ
jgi:hypothetical protein